MTDLLAPVLVTLITLACIYGFGVMSWKKGYDEGWSYGFTAGVESVKQYQVEEDE